MQLAGEEHEQPQRRHVGPVQVVEDDHQRPLRRPAAQVRRGQVIGTEADRGLVAQDAAPLLGDAGELGQHRLARAVALRASARTTWIHGQKPGAPSPSQQVPHTAAAPRVLA